MAMAEVYEVATFYHHFDVVKEGETAPPAITVRVCDSIACELAGSHDAAGGAAGTARHRRARPARAVCRPLRDRARRGRRPESGAARDGRESGGAGPGRDVTHPRDARSASDLDVDHARAISTMPPIERTADTRWPRRASRGDETGADVIALMEDSGLRGLGGAGFPAGRKWKIVAAGAGAAADGDQHRRGRAGHVQGPLLPRARPASLSRRRARSRRGRSASTRSTSICATSITAAARSWSARSRRCRRIRRVAIPPIHLRRGAGAYICGEESAMIESIEGKRGEPRLRPPYVAQVGLFGRPTLEHNMETLHWVRDIVEKGPAWFAGHGRHGRKGLRSFSVSGRVKKPGVHLAPAGITLQELIDEYCGGMLDGHTFYGYLPGGASGGILPASMAEHPARLRHLDAVRLLHRIGRRSSSCRTRTRRRPPRAT